MASHTDTWHDDMPEQALDELENSEFTFMVTIFTVSGAVDGCGRDIIKQYYDLIAPISGNHGGAELGSYAGCTVTCFKAAQDAVRAAVELQSAVEEKIWPVFPANRFLLVLLCIPDKVFAILLSSSGKGLPRRCDAHRLPVAVRCC